MILAPRQIGPPMIIAAITIGSLLYLAIALIMFKMLFIIEFLVSVVIRAHMTRMRELWIFAAMTIKAAFWPVTTLVYLTVWLVDDRIDSFK